MSVGTTGYSLLCTQLTRGGSVNLETEEAKCCINTVERLASLGRGYGEADWRQSLERLASLGRDCGEADWRRASLVSPRPPLLRKEAGIRD